MSQPVAPEAPRASSDSPAAPPFGRLAPRVQHAIVHSLGWRGLRPVQDMAIGPILDGDNVLLLAPTAGGKTEAAMLPVLSQLLPTAGQGIGALYLSPLRALLNNQEPRMTALAGMVGMSVFKWHGDVSDRDKKTFARTPGDILMLTPESLEVLLLSRRYRTTTLLGALRVVMVDEIHAFAGDDRGEHLLALLERLCHALQRDVQRIGLSATVGNPDTLLEWLHGSSQRGRRLIRPETPGLRRLVEIHPVADTDEVDQVVRRLVRGRKSLCFSESRGNSERLKGVVESSGVRTLVHHGSLSQELRETAEQAFRQATQCCIFCTSTMELGLDVGDLDLVLQIEAPSTVSALLQRLGRTGRRPGTVGHLAVVCENSWNFVQATALVRLATQHFVEPVALGRRNYGVYLQQMFSRLLANGGLPAPRLLADEGRVLGFEDITPADRHSLLDHLLAENILVCLDGVVNFGAEGEKRLGRRHFEALYSVFESSPQLEVHTQDHRHIGHVDAWFAQAMRPGEFVFVLGGRPWVVTSYDWTRRQVVVAPAAAGQIPSWLGGVALLHPRVCQTMCQVLTETGPVPFLHPPAQRELDRLRQEWGSTLGSGRVVLVEEADQVLVYTFAGARINYVLAKAIQRSTRRTVHLNNLWMSYRKSDVDAPLDPVFEALEAVRSLTDADVVELVALLPPMRLAKFQEYLPPGLQSRLIADRLFDVPGAIELLEDGVSVVRTDGRRE